MRWKGRFPSLTCQYAPKFQHLPESITRRMKAVLKIKGLSNKVACECISPCLILNMKYFARFANKLGAKSRQQSPHVPTIMQTSDKNSSVYNVCVCCRWFKLITFVLHEKIQDLWISPSKLWLQQYFTIYLPKGGLVRDISILLMGQKKQDSQAVALLEQKKSVSACCKT